jgi:hypothetical protein
MRCSSGRSASRTLAASSASRRIVFASSAPIARRSIASERRTRSSTRPRRWKSASRRAVIVYSHAAAGAPPGRNRRRATIAEANVSAVRSAAARLTHGGPGWNAAVIAGALLVAVGAGLGVLAGRDSMRPRRT